MSLPSEPNDQAELEEARDALPDLAQPRALQPHPPSGALARPAPVIPVAQAAAAVAGGFVAGAAIAGIVRRRQQREVALARGRRSGHGLTRRRGGRPATRPAELVQIIGSRSLLVDVHLLGER